MKAVRWGTPSEVSQYEFQGGKHYTEKELRSLAADSRIRSEGGYGVPLRIGYVYIEERGQSPYELDWLPMPTSRPSIADDDPLEWPKEPPHPTDTGQK